MSVIPGIAGISSPSTKCTFITSVSEPSAWRKGSSCPSKIETHFSPISPSKKRNNNYKPSTTPISRTWRRRLGFCWWDSPRSQYSGGLPSQCLLKSYAGMECWLIRWLRAKFKKRELLILDATDRTVHSFDKKQAKRLYTLYNYIFLEKVSNLHQHNANYLL